MSEPQWLTEALDIQFGPDQQDIRRMSWQHAVEVAQKNAEGFVVRCYNVHTDHLDWHFGPARWPKLIDPKTGEYFTDDPFRGRRDDIPVAEFMAYLTDWYFPQKMAMHWQSKAEV
jgi:hypothetical protein